MGKPLPAWLVFFGTRTAIVRAKNEDDAFTKFVQQFAPGQPDVMGGARLVLPTRDEVAIRRPRESDRGWLEDSGKPKFVALLKELPASVTH